MILGTRLKYLDVLANSGFLRDSSAFFKSIGDDSGAEVELTIQVAIYHSLGIKRFQDQYDYTGDEGDPVLVLLDSDYTDSFYFDQRDYYVMRENTNRKTSHYVRIGNNPHLKGRPLDRSIRDVVVLDGKFINGVIDQLEKEPKRRFFKSSWKPCERWDGYCSETLTRTIFDRHRNDIKKWFAHDRSQL